MRDALKLARAHFALTATLHFVPVVPMLPVIAACQGWTYWVFRKRLTGGDLPYG